MKKLFLVLLAGLMVFHAGAQSSSDFIVLKKKNNRTLRTYFPGSYLSGATYDGASLHGIIEKIKNDSIFLQQIDVRQLPTQFGTPILDTLTYSIVLPYSSIRVFNYNIQRLRDRGPSLLVPKLLQFGGIGYIILELVNTVYRKESLNDSKKLTGLGIAATTAAAGFLWQHQKQRNLIAGKNYKVEYVRMDESKK